jgi:hypothetical protein
LRVDEGQVGVHNQRPRHGNLTRIIGARHHHLQVVPVEEYGDGGLGLHTCANAGVEIVAKSIQTKESSMPNLTKE